MQPSPTSSQTSTTSNSLTLPPTQLITHTPLHLSSLSSKFPPIYYPSPHFSSYPILDSDFIIANIALKIPSTNYLSSLSSATSSVKDLSELTVKEKEKNKKDLKRRSTLTYPFPSSSLNPLFSPTSSSINNNDIYGNKNAFHLFLKSGYRSKLYHNPSETTAAILTCGGICPGTNMVLHSIVKTLKHYQCSKILGIKNSFSGLSSLSSSSSSTNKNSSIIVDLKEVRTEDFSLKGGSFLKSTRGGFSLEKITEALNLQKINILFLIGGDGTHTASLKLSSFLQKNNNKIGVVCLPKSIDNDLGIVDKTFGFETALDEARKAVLSIITEVQSSENCVGLVKVMGRESGFIASEVSKSSGDVDICVVPENKESVLCIAERIVEIIQKRGRCVVVFSEGAFQTPPSPSSSNNSKESNKEIMEKDAGGNKILKKMERDLIRLISENMKEKEINFNIKYNEPKYMIRTVGPNAQDTIYCSLLGQEAVHCAMAGYTEITVGSVNNRMVMVPLDLVVENSPRRMKKEGKAMERMWMSLNEDS